MATFRPGPLVHDLRGSAGGATFQAGSLTPTARAKIKPPFSQSSFQLSQRHLMTQANVNWLALTAAQRAAWSAILTGPESGRPLYLHAWLAQTGSRAVAAPPLPSHFAQPAQIEPGFSLDATDLYLTHFNRSLLPAEQAIVTIYKPLPPTRIAPISRVLRYCNAYANEGISTSPWLCQVVDDAVNGKATRNGVTTTVTSWTLDMWIKPNTIQASTVQTAWSFLTGNRALYWSIAALMKWRDPAGQFTFGTPPAPATWHLVSLNANGATSLITCYLDGAQFGTPVTYTPIAINGSQEIGQQVGFASRWLEGRFGPFRFSDVLRGLADHQAYWNNGLGKPFVNDASTAGLIPATESAGPTLADSSGNGRNWTRSNLTTSYGPFNRLACAAAERLGTSSNVRAAARALDPSFLPPTPTYGWTSF